MEKRLKKFRHKTEPRFGLSSKTPHNVISPSTMCRGTRKKGKIDITVSSFNAKSLNNKESSLRHAMGKQSIDVAIINEVSRTIPPPIRGYTYYQARDDRPFRGSVIYVKSTLSSVTTKVPDKSDEMDMEMIHLRLNTLPALHIIGVYLDCAPTVEHANNVQARLEAKLESITSKDEDCILMGDLNRPMDKPTELQKTRIMKSWIDSGKVM